MGVLRLEGSMSVINFECLGLDDMPDIFNFGRKEFSFIYLDRDTRMF